MSFESVNTQLRVFYDLGEFMTFRDDEIAELSGGKIVATGCAVSCGMVRDVIVEVPDESVAKIALQDAGFRFEAFCSEHH